MPPLYPLRFHPVYKERVWGGRNLERLYRRSLPPQRSIGESWEITDRPEEVSVVSDGPLAGETLRSLLEHRPVELMGGARTQGGRFPLLVKILDAQDTLSLQVHPPAAIAPQYGGEPKTEMWYVTHATPQAQLFAGLKRTVTRAGFESALAAGQVEGCFHRVGVRAGDSMFLPSGRVHAIGAGNVIFEIQQNSDTTYRVFDWNRVGLDGEPRELHLRESLASIDFNDFEPSLTPVIWEAAGKAQRRMLVSDPLFQVWEMLWSVPGEVGLPVPDHPHVVGVIRGCLELAGDQTGPTMQMGPGDFCLVPASCSHFRMLASEAVCLVAVPC